MYDAAKMEMAAADFLNARRVERLSEHTLADYAHTLRKFTEYLGEKPVNQVTPYDIRAFLGEQIHLSDKTLLNYHTGLSAFFKWCVQEGYAGSNVVRLVTPPRPEQREIHPFTRAQVVDLLDSAQYTRPYKRAKDHVTTRNVTEMGYRDLTILYVLLDCGVRASELCGIRLSDMQEASVRVMGKGNKERYVPLSGTTRAQLQRYLNTRQGLKPSSPLFASRGDQPMNRNSLRLMLERLGLRAGVTNCHPHRFRHTFAITYLRNRGDIYTLQRILGHSSLDMVKRYLQIAQTDVEAAHTVASPVANWHLKDREPSPWTPPEMRVKG